MARKKKDTEELEMELDELELDEEDTSEEEESDEEELKEPEEISLAEEDDEAEVEPAPKAPRRRAAKAKKAAPKVEVEAEAEETVVEKPAKAPKKTEAPIAAAVATPAPAPEAKDAVVLQWEAAKQASESIIGSLDKVNGMLRELPEYYSASLQKAFKNNTPRTSPAAKVAFGMSLVATVLSVLSLSFSQSARHAALTQVTVPAIHQMAPTPAPEKKIEQAAAEMPKKKAVRKSK